VFRTHSSFGLIALLAVAACSGEAGPSEKEIKNQFAALMPAHFDVESFDVKASQNAGTEVEPEWKSRFTAELELNAPTYNLDRVLSGVEGVFGGVVPFLKQAAKKGEKRTVYGTATSRLVAEKWETKWQVEEDSTLEVGKSLEEWGPKAIVTGSPEEKKFLQAQEQKIDQAVASLVGKRLSGTLVQHRVEYPAHMLIENYSPEDDSFVGRLETPSGIKSIRGTATPDFVLTFRDTAWIEEGKEPFPFFDSEYALKLDQSSQSLSGQWKHKNGWTGTLRVSL
jgi:hypothetical protein